ncbi:MAG: DUF177 domain-containing protein [Betaproteobacteria bacterium]|nr:MAG: DUF177 domain-containing protein [Betaproteobacteria bacterium]
MVDSLQFAKQHSSVRCSVPVSGLRRLAQAVLDDEDELEVGLDGFEDSEGRPCLHLHVTGSMTVTCQRCLEPLVLGVALDRRFVLAEQEQDLGDLGEEADDVDSLLADSKLDLLALAEDEILLQIPMAPMHEESKCTRPQWSSDAGREGSAFSVLGALTNTKD